MARQGSESFLKKVEGSEDQKVASQRDALEGSGILWNALHGYLAQQKTPTPLGLS